MKRAPLDRVDAFLLGVLTTLIIELLWSAAHG